MEQDEAIAREIFIASNSYDHKKLIEQVTKETVDYITPGSMLHEFSTRQSILENSIKNKDDFMMDYCISQGANIEPYKIINEINGNVREHNPIGLAIANGNENALYNLLDKRPDLLNENHIELFHKVAINRELTQAEIRDISGILEPVCKERQIQFDPQAMDLLYDLKATQQDNFKAFYNQVLNSNLPGVVEHQQSKELSEFTAVLRNPDGEVIYSGEFKYGRKDGLHFNLHNNVLSVSSYDNGREIAIPKDVEIFVALKNDNLKQIENLTTRATIDRLQPDNIDFFQKKEFGKLSLVETAIAEGKNDMAKFLIDKNCKLESYEIKDLTADHVRVHDPLMIALKKENHEMFNYIADKRPDLITDLHRQELEKTFKKENFETIKSIGTEHVIKETETLKELDARLKKCVQDGDTSGAKDAILKGADVKVLEKSDFAGLDNEKRQEMNYALKSGISEQTALDDLTQQKLKGGDEPGGVKMS